MTSRSNSTLLVLMVLLSHWRRHKIQLATLIVGLAAATALWTAVQALNSHARASYDRAATAVAGANRTAFVATAGDPFDMRAFAELRRAGIDVSPIVEGRLSPLGVRFTGIDPLTYGARDAGELPVSDSRSMLEFISPPGALIVHPQTVDALNAELAHIAETERPVVKTAETSPPGNAVGDIAAVQRLLGLGGKISKLVLAAGEPATADDLPAPWNRLLKRVEPAAQVDLAGLTDSFHLNLTAFGLLCFLVGLFIVYAAVGLAFEDRLGAIRTLGVCGVPRRQLLALMVLEMMLLALAAGAFGVLLGYAVASALLPDVAASLRGLYGARIGGVLSLDASWWIGGITISILGALGSSFGAVYKVSKMSLLETRGSAAWMLKQARSNRFKLGLALFLFSISLFFHGFGNGLAAAFIVMAGLLLGAAFLLPVLLSLILRLGGRFARTPISQWFWADSRQQLSGLSLALMALLLALGANIGVSGMVEGFRNTFDAFLEERLSADLYIAANSNAAAATLADWARQQADITAVLPIWNAPSRVKNLPVTVVGFEDHPSYRATWSLLSELDDPWRLTLTERGVLINEQLSYAQDLQVGDMLNLATDAGPETLVVAGIYADYGNPRPEVRMPNPKLVEWWSGSNRQRLALHISGDRSQTVGALQTRFNLSGNQMIDQAALKGFSRRIFEKTFTISDALSGLTLGVAGIAMFTSLLTLANARITGVAPLWAMGVSRRRIARLELMKILMLALLTAVAAVPLGVAVAWCLVAVINVEAFGWRLPLYLFPGQWAQLIVLGTATAFAAALYPVLKLRKTPPALLSKVFAHEH